MRILFDLSRYIRRSARSTLTGIDRVDLAYARFLPEFSDPVDYVAGRAMPRALSADAVARLLEPARDGAMNRVPVDSIFSALAGLLAQPAWDASRAGCRRLANPPSRRTSAFSRGMARFSLPLRTTALPSNLEGSVYINTSHSGLEDGRRLRSLRSRGARVAVMVHDLIPVDFPEFCRTGEDRKHEARLVNIAAHADLVIANSAYTRDRFLAWASRRKLRPPMVTFIPLGLELFEESRSLPIPLSPLPYFVCLGTIEARKNHAFLLLLWHRMVEKLGAACPRLVLVGRRGWKVETALDLLARSHGLSRAVIEVADLSDEGVAALIAGANGLLQPSFVEGFSLPVTETRILGTPVIASDIPAHRELADEGTVLLDCLDAPSWQKAIETLSEARSALVSTYQALTWREHVRQAVTEIAKITR